LNSISLDFQLKLYKVFFNINKHHTALFGNKFVVVASSHERNNNFYCILQFEWTHI